MTNRMSCQTEVETYSEKQILRIAMLPQDDNGFAYSGWQWVAGPSTALRKTEGLLSDGGFEILPPTEVDDVYEVEDHQPV